jgi:hypothetical protein
MMAARQKSLAVTVEERAELDKRKALYEKITGQHCDWGQFLLAISLLGMTALQDGYQIVTIVRVQHST